MDNIWFKNTHLWNDLGKFLFCSDSESSLPELSLLGSMPVFFLLRQPNAQQICPLGASDISMAGAWATSSRRLRLSLSIFWFIRLSCRVSLQHSSYVNWFRVFSRPPAAVAFTLSALPVTIRWPNAFIKMICCCRLPPQFFVACYR